MVVSQILGMLPALDFLPPIYLKLISFALGLGLVIAKGVEMFYDQSAQLESKTETAESYIKRDSSGVVESGQRQSVNTTTEPPKTP